MCIRDSGHVVDQDIIDPATGEVLIAAGERIPAAKTDPLAKKIQDAGVNDIYLRLEDRVVRVIGNNFVDAAAWLSEEEIEKSGINEMVHLPTPVSYTHLDVYKRQPRCISKT